MSQDEARRELAGIVHELRRTLEREARAGRGELLVRSVRRTTADGATGRAPAAVVEAPSAPAPSAARPAIDRSVSVTRIVVEGPGGPLNPIDPEERRRIAAEAAPVLARIAEEVEACKSCALWESRTRAVPGVGTALSGIAFVGEAPGADEDRKGEPFVGRAGQLLDRIIKAMDDAHLIEGVPLSRETVFIGNVIHCRPPENRVPLPFEVEQSSPFLRRQLEAIRPRIICCLGKTAAEHLLGQKASLASMRGRVYRVHGAKMIATYHPAAILRNPEWKRPVWEDMQMLAREYQTD